MERKIVVVAPTYNEEENIRGFLTSVLVNNVDVLVSDSHSSDRTGEIVKELARKNERVHYLDVKERGLGLGLSRGMDYAVDKLGADVIITMEADSSADPKQFPDFLKKLEKADLVLGSRYVSGGRIVNWSWWRKLLSLTGNLILQFFAWTTKVHEFTNLYRAFNKNVWIKIRPKIIMYNDWLFVPAFTFEALTSGFKVVEQPVIFTDRFGGKSKMKTLSYTKNLLLYALRYRLKKVRFN